MVININYYTDVLYLSIYYSMKPVMVLMGINWSDKQFEILKNNKNII